MQIQYVKYHFHSAFKIKDLLGFGKYFFFFFFWLGNCKEQSWDQSQRKYALELLKVTCYLDSKKLVQNLMIPFVTSHKNSGVLIRSPNIQKYY